MKRIRPAPMGRAYRYQRRLSHIAISVAERAHAEGLVHRVGEDSAAEPGKRAAAKKTAGRKSTAKKAAPKKATAHKPAKKVAAKKPAKKK
jgi:large subunit ribosomal protein L22